MITAEDRIAIRDLLVRYVHGVRTKRFDLLDQVFTADAVVDMSAVGGGKDSWSAIRGWLASFAGSAHLFQITVGNEVITSEQELEIGLATTWSAIYVPAEGTPAITSYGSYEDRLARTANGWRIVERVDIPALILTGPPT